MVLVTTDLASVSVPRASRGSFVWSLVPEALLVVAAWVDAAVKMGVTAITSLENAGALVVGWVRTVPFPALLVSLVQTVFTAVTVTMVTLNCGQKTFDE